ncbi:MAG: winged helix-turn-helix transcriptional regulator [Chloroflexi bacterium]|nr:winged helix-turn-helix transcriptional regulator [Chloroflexota bacterium]
MVRGRSRLLRRGDLHIDLLSREARVGERAVALTFTEYDLLRLLASSPGRVFTREELLERLWRSGYGEGTRTVDVHVARLRSKIEDGSHAFIETVRSVGYRFRP